MNDEKFREILLTELNKLSPEEKESMLIWLLRYYSVTNDMVSHIMDIFDATAETILVMDNDDPMSSGNLSSLILGINKKIQEIENGNPSSQD